jgi:hypothetical protein
MGDLYNKVFTGEIPPLIIDKNSPLLDLSVYQANNSVEFRYHELSLIRWRDIVKKHLPVNANLATVEAELKLEYLHFDYLIPSRVVVPSTAIPNIERRESTLQKQVKTLEFKNKYNRNGNYAFEFRLIKEYDQDHTLDSLTPYTNQISYNAKLDYPIADLIYNNRLPGYVDLMPYLIKNGTLIFADVKQELKIQILPDLGDGDYIVCGGGYSGSVTYELLPIVPVVSKSQVYSVGTNPIKVLDYNSKRLSLYLCNLGTKDIFYSFSSIRNEVGLILKPKETLIYENNNLIINNQIIDPGDSCFSMGLSLWVWNSQAVEHRVAVEEISYS